MAEAWMLGAGLLLGAAVGLVLYLSFVRRDQVVVFTDKREESLAQRLAGQLRCPLPAALEAIRRELAIDPEQSDETILKRAGYHYRRNLPDPGPCRTFRDRAPG